MKKEIVIVAGARPNFMKIAPILRLIDRGQAGLKALLVHTGQHYDPALSEVFFEQLGIRAPDHHLEVGSGSHGSQTAKVMIAFEELLVGLPALPAGVVVVGDVNSTMAATVVASKLCVPVAHVEAGLRSFDRTMPEEINRMITDAVADLLLVSEPSGEENLLREGIAPQRIHFVGNVMIDTLVRELEAAKALDICAELDLQPQTFALVTLHRPSNVDTRERLSEVVDFLAGVGQQVQVVFPVHPRTRKQLESFDLLARLEQAQGLRLLSPLGYRQNLGLMASAKLVITDSGGIQEETSYLGVPCLTIRPNTERPVTVTLGTNTVENDLPRAKSLIGQILDGSYKRGEPIPLWDGHAAERIVAVLSEAWSAG